MSATVERTELITPEPSAALAGLLDVPLPEPDEGLPLTWHWVHLLDRPPQSDLGPDGHAVRGTLPAPPGPGRRRMWAGGSVRRLGPLRVGEPATRRSSVTATEEKVGRSGRLAFVTVGHTVSQRGQVVVEERQDVVYREAAAAPATAVGGTSGTPAVGPDEWSLTVDPVLLFRFSALTYNGHRIHYDRDYARTEEGYPGLVVHGPLQAVAMAEAARRRGLGTRLGQVLDYRLVAPLLEGQGLVVRSVERDGGVETSVRDASGRRTAVGRLS